MAKWSDDYHLNIQQRRLDADQLRAVRKMLEKDPDNEDLKSEIVRINRLLNEA